MPVIVRWYLKTALVYFMAALVLGVFQALGGAVGFVPPGATPVYYHLLMVGWVTQVILGVAIWMFPKFSLSQPRGNERLFWAAYFLLNFGLVFRAVGEPITAIANPSGWGWLLVVSALLQWLAGTLIVGTIWNRVKQK